MKRLLLPLLLMAASAASLWLGFWVLRSALAGFCLYYLLCCLVLPTAALLAAGKATPRALPSLLGLLPLRGADLGLGLGIGLAMSAPMVLVLALFRQELFGDGRIREVLARWGASGDRALLVYVAMLAFNGIVEELFWRGFIHDRLRALPNRWVALGLPALFFAAQHLFVVSSLVASPGLIALFLAGILGAGVVWSLLRELRGSVIPSLVSHVLVTAGYMAAFLCFTP